MLSIHKLQYINNHILWDMADYDGEIGTFLRPGFVREFHFYSNKNSEGGGQTGSVHSTGSRSSLRSILERASDGSRTYKPKGAMQ